MLRRILILVSSKSRKIVTPLNYRKHWMWKTNNMLEITEIIPRNHNGFHFHWHLESVEWPTNLSSVESTVKNCSLKYFMTLFTSQNQMNNDIPGKIYFNFLPGNGAKDVSARNCSRLQEEQANTISKMKQSKTVFYIAFGLKFS